MQLNIGIQRQATLTKSMPILEPGSSLSKRGGEISSTAADLITVNQLKNDDSFERGGGAATGTASTLLPDGHNSLLKHQKKSTGNKKGALSKASTLQTQDYQKLLLNGNLSERLVEGLIYEPIRKNSDEEVEQQQATLEHGQNSNNLLAFGDPDNDQTLYK